MEVKVNGEIISSTDKPKLFYKGEVVVDQCFTSLDKVEIFNPTPDGWAGSVLATHYGRTSSYYSFSECLKCLRGVAPSAQEDIVVDGDYRGASLGKNACMHGLTCELRFVPGLDKILNKTNIREFTRDYELKIYQRLYTNTVPTFNAGIHALYPVHTTNN